MRRHWIAVALVLAAAPLGAQAPAQAPQGEELDALTRQVASEMRCPVCQGLSINDSPVELAQQMKAVVRDQLAAGRTPDEVKAYFVSKYGEWVLLEPRASGMNLLVYVLPIVALLAGAVVVAASVRRWTRSAAEAGGAEEPAPPPASASPGV